MSQKKVDAYKAEKANREKIMKKKRAILNLEKLAALVVCIVAVCWIGYCVCWQGNRGTGDRTDRDCYGYLRTGFLSERTERGRGIK